MDNLPWILLGALVLWVVVRQVMLARSRVPVEEAKKKVDEGALLVDVRSPAEYSAGHIDGAVNIPVQVLEHRLGELEKDRPVVVYCRSGSRSHLAAKMLGARGYEALDLGPQARWR